MSDFINYLKGRAAAGGMNRREFMGRAMAAGLTLTAASTLYATSASAQEPKRGGHLKLGLEGAAATDSRDPAKSLSQFTFVMGRCWGDMLVESEPLTGAAGPKVQADIKQIILKGRQIDAEKALRTENAINGVASLVPRSWELVSRTPQGQETVLATNVASYDLLADGSIIYSNGRAVFTLGRASQSSLLLQADLIDDIVGRSA